MPRTFEGLTLQVVGAGLSAKQRVTVHLDNESRKLTIVPCNASVATTISVPEEGKYTSSQSNLMILPTNNQPHTYIFEPDNETDGTEALLPLIEAIKDINNPDRSSNNSTSSRSTTGSNTSVSQNQIFKNVTVTKKRGNSSAIPEVKSTSVTVVPPNPFHTSYYIEYGDNNNSQHIRATKSVTHKEPNVTLTQENGDQYQFTFTARADAGKFATAAKNLIPIQNNTAIARNPIWIPLLLTLLAASIGGVSGYLWVKKGLVGVSDDESASPECFGIDEDIAGPIAGAVLGAMLALAFSMVLTGKLASLATPLFSSYNRSTSTDKSTGQELRHSNSSQYWSNIT